MPDWGPLGDRRFWSDILQGMTDAANRGVVGGTLGAPIDLPNLALSQNLGIPGGGRTRALASDQPFLGSEWWGQKMQDAGMVSSNRNPIAETLMSLLAPGGAAKAGRGISATEDALLRELSKPGTMAGSPAAQEGAIKVFHGSPHTFDKFDLSKIGTGEGAQAYGHGLYFAESPAVARQYQETLSGKTRSGTPLNWDDPVDVASMRLRQFGGDADAAIKFVKEGRANPKVSKDNERAAAFSDRVIDTLREGKATNAVDQGQMYETSLRWPDPAREAADPLGPQHFLDWDKPLTEQSPQIIDKLRAAKLSQVEPRDKWASGQDIWNNLASTVRTSGLGPSGAHQTMREAGIPGIRYLDAGSRGAGEGTANYVLFDDALAEILKRNGVPVPKAVTQRRALEDYVRRIQTGVAGLEGEAKYKALRDAARELEGL